MSDTIAVNKAYFDKLASDYDRRFEKTITQLAQEIQNRRDFIGVDWVDDDSDDEAAPGDAKKTVKLLDYACGTGLVSRSLAQFTTQCVGVDISANMVGAFNSRAENQGLSPDEMHAYHGNLTDPADPSPAALAGDLFFGFDLAVVGLGFHHFDDPEYAARQLVARLKPGGVLLIIDFFEHGGHGHDHSHHGHKHDGHDHKEHEGHNHKHDGHEHKEDSGHSHGTQTSSGVMHHGFSEERMRAMFEGAGAGKDYALQEVGSGLVFHGTGDERKRRIFLARGVKA
ncbi:hypothetical protein ACHAQA_007626 [Verticillium albo-atrum]